MTHYLVLLCLIVPNKRSFKVFVDSFHNSRKSLKFLFTASGRVGHEQVRMDTITTIACLEIVNATQTAVKNVHTASCSYIPNHYYYTGNISR